jgi:hypothetical protein
MHSVPAPGAPDSTAEHLLGTTPPISSTGLSAPAPELPGTGTRAPAVNGFRAIFAGGSAATAEPPATSTGSPTETIDAPVATDAPALASELNARWAAARMPFRLDRRGVAQLWAVCAAGTEAQAPLLFIVGSEKRAVHQAQRWAALAWPKAAATAA